MTDRTPREILDLCATIHTGWAQGVDLVPHVWTLLCVLAAGGVR